MTQKYLLDVYGDSRQPQSLEEWVHEFSRIFGEANHGLPWWGFERRMHKWALAMQDPRLFLQANLGQFDKFAAKFFSWFCGFVRRVNIPDISRQIFLEYPGICPRCLRDKCGGDCKGTYFRDRARVNAIAAEKLQSMPSNFTFSLSALTSHAFSIYPENADITVFEAAGRFAAECRELASATARWRHRYQVGDRRAVESVFEELPDVLFWFVTVLELAQREKTFTNYGPRKSPDEIVWDFYKVGCPDCSPRTSERVCQCHQGARDAEHFLVELFEANPEMGKDRETATVIDGELVD